MANLFWLWVLSVMLAYFLGKEVEQRAWGKWLEERRMRK